LLFLKKGILLKATGMVGGKEVPLNSETDGFSSGSGSSVEKLEY